MIKVVARGAPTQEMEGDVGGHLDPVREDAHDAADDLLPIRERQDEAGRGGGSSTGYPGRNRSYASATTPQLSARDLPCQAS
ncbi:hypothetical protein ACWCQ0_41170 [Streptomyces massasporeus]|uniref:Uncharacterized protein n=1 Tax=Streptomyces massasporeus TaxID=67324 RepID=A0ABW6LK58_9ACTN